MPRPRQHAEVYEHYDKTTKTGELWKEETPFSEIDTLSCMYCKKKYKSTNITRLKRHLIECEADVPAEVREKLSLMLFAAQVKTVQQSAKKKKKSKRSKKKKHRHRSSSSSDDSDDEKTGKDENAGAGGDGTKAIEPPKSKVSAKARFDLLHKNCVDRIDTHPKLDGGCKEFVKTLFEDLSMLFCELMEEQENKIRYEKQRYHDLSTRVKRVATGKGISLGSALKRRNMISQFDGNAFSQTSALESDDDSSSTDSSSSSTDSSSSDSDSDSDSDAVTGGSDGETQQSNQLAIMGSADVQAGVNVSEQTLVQITQSLEQQGSANNQPTSTTGGRDRYRQSTKKHSNLSPEQRQMIYDFYRAHRHKKKKWIMKRFRHLKITAGAFYSIITVGDKNKGNPNAIKTQKSSKLTLAQEQEVVAYSRANPDKSARQVGRQFGLTKDYAYWIMRKNGIRRPTAQELRKLKCMQEGTPYTSYVPEDKKAAFNAYQSAYYKRKRAIAKGLPVDNIPQVPAPTGMSSGVNRIRSNRPAVVRRRAGGIRGRKKDDESWSESEEDSDTKPAVTQQQSQQHHPSSLASLQKFQTPMTTRNASASQRQAQRQSSQNTLTANTPNNQLQLDLVVGTDGQTYLSSSMFPGTSASHLQAQHQQQQQTYGVAQLGSAQTFSNMIQMQNSLGNLQQHTQPGVISFTNHQSQTFGLNTHPHTSSGGFYHH